ncbi:hypothetical protein ALI144C_30810 [Actinosynnema sp. ALI-1.44]|nr:hypothetical protein ALI144C_30810 [Actinosynnema sp. ALI-1.44]
MMRQRYDEDAEYERGNTGKPDFPRYLVVLDEVQGIRATLGKNELDPILQQISRQIRASKGKLLLATQRPDAEDAIPGAVRDMTPFPAGDRRASAVAYAVSRGATWIARGNIQRSNTSTRRKPRQPTQQPKPGPAPSSQRASLSGPHDRPQTRPATPLRKTA